MNFPFFATLITLAGFIVLILALFLSTWRRRLRNVLQDDPNLPNDFGPRLTSARLRYVRWAFALLVLTALGFHFYWGLFATGPLDQNEAFARLKNRRDQRNRRELDSTLRGWIFDRRQDPEHALARYKYFDGQIKRDYPYGASAAHLVGYATLLRGDTLLERAVVAPRDPQAPKSWWQQITQFSNEEQLPPVGKDLVLTIDAELQQEATKQLNNRRGAVVVINPQTGAILALVSSPSFNPADINDNVKWRDLQNDVKNKPLLNRALDEYYLPGSTLKTLTAAAALEGRREDLVFTCRSEGWTPPGSGRPIRDDEGESHGSIGLLEAYTRSCNQYFAQLGVEVGRQQMGVTAKQFGLSVFDDPADSIGTGAISGLWNTENRLLSDVLAPLNSTFVAGDKVTKYDLGLESIGQGFVQLTPLQMAIVAGAAANAQGQVMRPMLESGRAPVVMKQAMTRETAARMRTLMASVVQRGTASGTFGRMLTGRVNAGGKTGTAQRAIPLVDAQTGKYVTFQDARGRTRIRMAEKPRIDSWFIGFAPVENPLMAWAVVVEEGGYGAKIAAPIAGQLVLKAQSLGLLTPPSPTASPKASPSPTPQISRKK